MPFPFPISSQVPQEINGLAGGFFNVTSASLTIDANATAGATLFASQQGGNQTGHILVARHVETAAASAAVAIPNVVLFGGIVTDGEFSVPMNIVTIASTSIASSAIEWRGTTFSAHIPRAYQLCVTASNSNVVSSATVTFVAAIYGRNY